MNMKTSDTILKLYMEDESLYEKAFDLKHNKTPEIDFIFKLKQKGEDLKLEFLLYKNQNFTKPYRDLHLWVNVK